ncbi:MAG: ABC transporter ATP-binding protein [Planctomycetota bacterium]|jgi:lipoprotein-releasing system ATP-binding protein|nr:ABC transporter ATP-binding protein [Planctomycetota bacterium]
MKPLLDAHGVKKTYRLGQTSVPVLHDASLSVAQGEWVAIVGSSGSGKSTLLHLLGGLDRADKDSGPISYDGEDLRGFSPARENLYRNRDVGFVFQFYHLLPELTVLENAMLPSLVGLSRLAWLTGRRAELRDRAAELLGTCGLGHRLKHRPAELSGGERQRVAIARALINKPRVLLADEPTGNLDVRTGGGILDLLAERQAEGLTMVMVTHDQSVAARAHRQVKIVDGRVA